MSNVKRIDTLLRLKNLNARELDLHKDLIEESMEREALIEECSARTQTSLQQLADTCEAATQRARILAEAIEKVLDEMEDLCLKLLPEDQFFHD